MAMMGHHNAMTTARYVRSFRRRRCDAVDHSTVRSVHRLITTRCAHGARLQTRSAQTGLATQRSLLTTADRQRGRSRNPQQRSSRLHRQCQQAMAHRYERLSACRRLGGTTQLLCPCKQPATAQAVRRCGLAAGPSLRRQTAQSQRCFRWQRRLSWSLKLQRRLHPRDSFAAAAAKIARLSLHMRLQSSAGCR